MDAISIHNITDWTDHVAGVFKKQGDFEWINKWTLNITLLTSFIGFPLLISAIFYGKEILSLIYGMKYGAVSIPFAIIFTNALMRTVSVPIATVYISIGQPKLHRLFTGIRTVIIVALIWPAIMYFGLIGAATSGLIAMLVGNIIQATRMNKITGLSLRQYFEIFPLSILFSSCIVLFGSLSMYFSISNPILKTAIGVSGCVISYGIMIVYLMKSMKWRFRDGFA